MANYISSLVLDFQTKPKGVFSEFEMRDKRSQLLDLFIDNPTDVFESWNKLKTSDQKPGVAHLLTRQKSAVGDKRQAKHLGVFGDSIKRNLTWKTYQSPFAVSMKAGDRNIFNNKERFENLLKNAVLDIHEKIDEDLNAFLALKKSQSVLATAQGATWNPTTFAYELEQGDREYYAQIAKSVMRQNGYKGSFDVVADSLLRMETERLFANGAQNAKNTAFQAGGLSFYEDHNLIDSGYMSTGYLIPNGGVALLPWIPKVNRGAGKGNEDSNIGLFTNIKDPLGSGLTFALHVKNELRDTDNTGGETQDVVSEIELSIDLAYETAPLSDSNESCIVKFANKK